MAVTSLPAAADQSVHLDMPPLFDLEPLGGGLPSYYVTLVLPLVDLNAMNGTTAYFPEAISRSHLNLLKQPRSCPMCLLVMP